VHLAHHVGCGPVKNMLNAEYEIRCGHEVY